VSGKEDGLLVAENYLSLGVTSGSAEKFNFYSILHFQA
jgi:hypothetical protein